MYRTARATHEQERRLPVGLGRQAWESLPALAVASAAWSLAGAVVVGLAPGVSPVSVLVAAVLFGPFAASLAAVVNDIALRDGASVRSWLRSIRRLTGFGIAQHLTVALPAALFVVAIHVWKATDEPWVLLSVGVSGAASLLGVLGLPAVLILGAPAERQRWSKLWSTSLVVVAAHPIRMTAAPALAGFGVWVATTWSASVLLLVPAPVALVAVAAVWTSVDPAARELENDG